MANFAVILPAAGKSSRFSVQKRKKPFVELKGRPVWVRAAEHFLNREDVSQVLLVVSREDMDWVKEKFRANLAFMNIEIVEGGAERFESVQKALARVKADVDFVFDVPVQLAAELCGYQHDRWKFDWGEPVFSRLEPART